MKLNTLMVVALIASTSLATAPAMADDAHHPERAQAAQSAPTQATAKSSEQTVKAMQANVKKMQIQLDRIATAKTDDERQKALMDHMQTMQESMQMGRGMQSGMTGCPMMGTMGQGGMMMGSGNSTEGRMQQMEKRMDMMEMMMKSGGQGMPGMGKP
jgi:hypothetical protein